MKISQVYLSMGRFDIAKECFEHNMAMCGRKPDEIVWVDNGSTDGTAEFAREHADICVLNKRNMGMAHGFNTGWMLATGDMIAMVHIYAKAPENWLKAFADVYESSKADGICIYHDAVADNPTRFRGGEETHAGFKCQRSLFIESCFFPKSNLDKFGYYDESLDPYWPTDVEYTFRLDRHGFSALAIHGLTVEHCGRGNDIEPMMPNPATGEMMPYFEWKNTVQWRPECRARIQSNAANGWPRIGFNQKPIPCTH